MLMFSISFIIALILGIVFTKFAIKIALKFNIVDIPNTRVKTHKKVTPYLGGVAIAFSFLITSLMIIITFKLDVDKEIYVILASSLIIILLGFIDDVKNVSPLKKVVFQCLAAVTVISFGTRINLINIEILDMILTVFWIVSLTNAFNLIDIMDGLASGVAGIAATVLSILYLQINEVFLSLLLLTLMGSCLGFLKYNFKPAQIFMGDTGSLFLGFILACVSISFINSDGDIPSIFILVLIFAIPIFETLFVSILRIKGGKSPFKGSKDHFALRMVKSGLSIKKTVLATYAVGIVLGLISIVVLNFKGMIPYFIIPILIGVVIVTRRLIRIDMNNF